MSHQPSPSTSPNASPEPFRRIWFSTAAASARTFVKRTPVVAGSERVKPSRPPAGAVILAARKPLDAFHSSPPGAPAAQLPAIQRTTKISPATKEKRRISLLVIYAVAVSLADRHDQGEPNFRLWPRRRPLLDQIPQGRQPLLQI